MIEILTSLGLLALAVHALHLYWLRRELPQVHSMKFDGELYRVGETCIAVERPVAGATRTVICFPGFLEDVRYFLPLYEGRGYELILINNANYYSPFDQVGVKTLSWPTNPYHTGTIAHDGFVVAYALQEFATTNDIVIHGHSRGGAVVLDAGRQFPEIMKDESRRITAFLEAAVLPQGTQANGPSGPVASAITLYLMPIVLGLLRNLPVTWFEKTPMMIPPNVLKRDLFETLFSNTKSYATCVENARDIAEWQQNQRYDLYTGYHEIAVFVGERDDVLNTKTMTASAEEGQKQNPKVEIIQTSKTNHFISLELPEAIYRALGETAAEAPPRIQN